MDQVFVDTGYESQFFVRNAGSLFVFMIVFIVVLACLPACLICARLCTCCKSLHERIKKKLVFNPFIRILLEATLDFSFSIFIQRTTLDKEIEEQSLFETVNTIALWFCIVLFSILPIAIAIFLCYNFEKLNSERFIERYGALYLGLDVNKRLSLIYPI